jgi:riboflavin kinase/FMN adenylyltransferase
MKVYRSVEEFTKLSNAVVTSGFFDGVHKGHQKILSHLVETAKLINGQSVVITFWPHPKRILHTSGADIKTITTLEEKIKLMEDLSIDHFLIIPFTEEFSKISSSEFVNNILINCIGTKHLIIGYDHKFGRNREGSFDYLKLHASTFGFEVDEIPRQDVDNLAVSSTLIRKSLSEGNVNNVFSYLGRYYSVQGTVVKGKQLGQTIGYPTANIELNDSDKLIPKDGIYAVKIGYKNTMYNGMMSIGFNPTVNGKNKTIEVNIFDFNFSIYNENLEVFFVEYLRAEEKFDSLEGLVEQLHKDKENSLRILNKN